MHGAPLHYKPGTMRRWTEEDNKGVEIKGIRWLLKELAPGKTASSLLEASLGTGGAERVYMTLNGGDRGCGCWNFLYPPAQVRPD